MKKDNLYDPIYGYTPKDDSIIITPSFLSDERSISFLTIEIKFVKILLFNTFRKTKSIAWTELVPS